MNKIDFVLADMTSVHIPEVVLLHLSQLQDDFCACLGSHFLNSVFYPYFLKQQGGVGLVALHTKEDPKAEVVGFVISHAGQGYYTRLIKQNFLSMCLWNSIALVRRPRTLLYILDIVKVLFSQQAFQPKGQDAELLYIAVSPAYQGQSIGRALTQALLDKLAVGPYRRCVVKTLDATPQNTRFYQRNGFRIVKEALGRVWLTCILPLQGQDIDDATGEYDE